jgi:lipopolysaccharide/colanic/teichoic acid biosynthesis glycosyltransferase
MLKRLFDVSIAASALLALLPLMIVIAVVVRLNSPGSPLFRQARVSRGGRLFEILKFRTMAVTDGSGAQITVGNDPRITSVGAVLRRTKLDELPQLINVLKGDMSLVGPRPEVPRYVAMYPPELRDIVLSVRPGITDIASLEFRRESELLGAATDPERVYVEEIMPRKLALYARYVRERSFIGDLRIMLRTLRAIVTD